MALDPRILLQQTTPNVIGALTAGLEAGRAIRMAPILERLQEQRLAQGELQQQRQQFALERGQVEAERQDAIQRGKTINSFAKQLRQIPTEQERRIVAERNMGVLSGLGVDPSDLEDLSDVAIDQVISATEQFSIEDVKDINKLRIEERKLEERRLQREQRALEFKAKSGELKPGVQKILETAQNESVEAGARARQLKFLADDLRRIETIGGGAPARFSEFLKVQLGTQDDVTELRRRFNAIRSSEAVQNLPPGVASDKDIELALKGFPRDDAPKEQIISFLQGAHKMARFREEYNRIKSELISEKGSTRGLLKELRDNIPELQKSFEEEFQALSEETPVVQQPETPQVQQQSFTSKSGITFTVE